MFVPQIMYFPFLLWKSCFGLFLVDGKAASYLRLKTNLSLCVFPLLCGTSVLLWLLHSGCTMAWWHQHWILGCSVDKLYIRSEAQ